MRTPEPSCGGGDERPILWRLLPPLGILLALVVAGAGGMLWRQSRIHLDARQADACAAVASGLETALRQQSFVLAGQVRSIVADPRVGQAFKEKDHARLASDWGPAFEALKRDLNFTHFNFIGPDRKVWLRMHRPELRGDVVERYAVGEALKTGGVGIGKEIGAVGTLVLRVAQAVVDGETGETLGVVELGKEIEHLLNAIEHPEGSHFRVTLSKTSLARSEWEEWSRTIGREPDWERFRNCVALYCKHGRMTDAFDAFMDDDAEGGGGVRRAYIEDGGTTWSVESIPLKDAWGRKVGETLAMVDVGGELARFRREMILGGTVAAAFMAGVVWFLVVLLSRTDQLVAVQRKTICAERDKAKSYLDVSGVMFIALDREGRIALVNRKGCEVLGRSREEIVGKDWFSEYIPAAERDATRGVFGKIVSGDVELVSEHENQIVGADGRMRTIAWWNTTLRGSDGGVEGTLSSGMDITEKRELEGKLLQYQKEESLRRMAGAVAHHYNNLMQVVRMNLEILASKPAADADSAEVLGEAMVAAKRAGDLGGMLLAYLGERKEPTEEIDLAEACRAVLSQLQSTLSTKNRLIADIPEKGPKVKANATLAGKILLGMVRNAEESMGGVGGSIRIGIRVVGADAIPGIDRWPVDFRAGTGGYACLETSDTGCGIAREDMGKLFDPFYTTKFPGRGLGLAVALGTVSQWGGCMAVRSEVGAGSCFGIYLPMAR